jgi:hypothetical protein
MGPRGGGCVGPMGILIVTGYCNPVWAGSAANCTYIRSQQSIVQEYYRQHPTEKRLAELLRPLFLKANEKISYATEERDKLNIDRSNAQLLNLPEKMLDYTRAIPKRIVANTLYFSTVN